MSELKKIDTPEKLRELRQRIGDKTGKRISQKKFALVFGVAQFMLSRWERGNNEKNENFMLPDKHKMAATLLDLAFDDPANQVERLAKIRQEVESILS